ncbi:MAG: 4-phosphoerythronate dehydrogenase PdxB [Candidatus Hydrogenedentes bacterium]|nr:4-phosphoerythronate dehydrogenase PdxB [Candidatus Hydrogenedentota bacterium]
MKIVVDENIPFGREAFGLLGSVVTLPGRTISAKDLGDAELLIVRSITKVDAALLDSSRVRFVGTCTIGTDHVDTAYLSKKRIAFSSAPGCNANSVADYVTAALLELSEHHGFRLAGKSLGVVGVGNVGSRVAARGAALGMTCVLNDPPLARQTNDPKYQPIDAILECDVVTFHVPLTKAKPHATHHLVNEAFLRRLKPDTILINSSRGPVVDNAALVRALEGGALKACVLDVWEGEPSINLRLLDETFIGTPHIAGYSFDGKVNGTRQVYESACQFLGVTPSWDPSPLLPEPECPSVKVRGDAADPEESLRAAVRAVYDIRRDDSAMRALLSAAESERTRMFDRLRKEYPRRREFINTRAEVAPRNAKLESRLKQLGFRVSGSGSRM